jgi:hypothetical protein
MVILLNFNAILNFKKKIKIILILARSMLILFKYLLTSLINYLQIIHGPVSPCRAIFFGLSVEKI